MPSREIIFREPSVETSRKMRNKSGTAISDMFLDSTYPGESVGKSLGNTVRLVSLDPHRVFVDHGTSDIFWKI